MVCTNLSAVLNMIKRDTTSHTEKLRVRRILHNNRNNSAPLYVVVMSSGAMFVVSEYMPALTFEKSGGRVFGVWRDTNCNWHVVEQ